MRDRGLGVTLAETDRASARFRNRNSAATLPLPAVRSSFAESSYVSSVATIYRLDNLHLDNLADASDSEVVLAQRTDHDGGVGTPLVVDAVLPVDPGSLDDQRAVGIRASFVGHVISLRETVALPGPPPDRPASYGSR
jgi:hypothetical protein